MAREWLLRGVDPEELKKDDYSDIPETPQSKWDNFWYHHKWSFWGCVFAVVAVAIVVVQMFTGESPDYRVLLVTENSYMSGDAERLEKFLATYGTDLNEDGEVLVNIQNCLYGENARRTNNSGPQMLQAHLVSGDVLFFVWDEASYHLFMESIEPQMEDGAEFLADIPAEGRGVIEEGKIYTWEYDHRRLDFEGIFPKKLYFGIRFPQGTAAESTELYDQSMALMEAFIAGQNASK